MDFDAILLELHHNKLIRSHEEAMAFDQALEQLPESLTPNQVQFLLLVFDDQCIHFEVMWGLVHYVERYGDRQLTAAYLTALPSMALNAHDWAALIMTRMLNSENERNDLVERLTIAESTVRSLVKSILDKIAAQNREPVAGRARLVLQSVEE